MMGQKIKKLVFIFGVIVGIGILGYLFLPSLLIKSIQISHIEGNAPEDADFDQFLKRDLESYFTNALGRKTVVDFEFLRKGATQSGVAYPKYYVWVKVKAEGIEIEDGAVRVAAIDKEKFEITDYVSRQEINSNPNVLYRIFPKVLCPGIINRAK